MRHDHIKVITQEGRNNTTRNNKKKTKIKIFNVKWVNMTIIDQPSFKKEGGKEIIGSLRCDKTF